MEALLSLSTFSSKLVFFDKISKTAPFNSLHFSRRQLKRKVHIICNTRVIYTIYSSDVPSHKFVLFNASI